MINRRQMVRKKEKEQAAGPTATQSVIDPQMVQDYPVAKRKKLETASAAATEMLYNPKTKGDVQKMLQNTSPEMSIPMTVNAVFDRFEGISQKSMGKMPLEMKLGIGVHLFKEVMELAEAMGIVPKDMPEENQQPLLRATIQQYIQKGLKDKSIDPIELQKEVEPLLNEEEKTVGGTLAQAQGIPMDITGQQSAQGMLSKKMQPLQVENAYLKKQMGQMQGALQGVANAPQEGEGGQA